MLAAFALLSVTVLAALATRPLEMSGADSNLAADQLQYFAWIRAAGEEIVSRNMFEIDPASEGYFLHPGYLITGLLYRLGVDIPVAYTLLWKPVAVVVVFFGFRAYIRRLLPTSGQRLPALVLALFYVSPAAALIGFAHIGDTEFQRWLSFLSGELFPGHYTSGYMMQAISVGLQPLILLAAERARIPERRRPGRTGAWYAAWAAAGGFLAAWLHPWQAVAVLATVCAVELISWRRGRRFALRGTLTGVGPLLSRLCRAAGLLLATVSAGSVLGSERGRQPKLGRLPRVGLGHSSAAAGGARRTCLPDPRTGMAGAGGARLAVRHGWRVLADFSRECRDFPIS